jgi:hypothetical protein
MSKNAAKSQRAIGGGRHVVCMAVAIIVLAMVALLIVLLRPAAAAKVDIGIDLSQQQMRFSVLGRPSYH